MLDVVNETLTVCKTPEQLWLPAVWTLWFAFFDPGAETMLAGQFAAGRAHAGFLDVLEADVALKERDVLIISTH